MIKTVQGCRVAVEAATSVFIWIATVPAVDTLNVPFIIREKSVFAVGVAVVVTLVPFATMESACCVVVADCAWKITETSDKTALCCLSVSQIPVVVAAVLYFPRSVSL